MKPDLYPRRCDECRTGMWEGYVFAGDETYCEACAFDSPEDKAEWIANWTPEGDDYWTEWTELEDEAYTKEGHPIPVDELGRPLPHLPSKLSRMLCDIEKKRLASQTFTGFWDAFTSACLDYRVHGLDMPDSLAAWHIRNLEREDKDEH